MSDEDILIDDDILIGDDIYLPDRKKPVTIIDIVDDDFIYRGSKSAQGKLVRVTDDVIDKDVFVNVERGIPKNLIKHIKKWK